MKKPLKILTLVMLVVVTLWHFFCAFGIIALSTGFSSDQEMSWPHLGLLFIVFPPIVIIRRIWVHKWTKTDAIIAWLGLSPGIVITTWLTMCFFPPLFILLVGYITLGIMVSHLSKLDVKYTDELSE